MLEFFLRMVLFILKMLLFLGMIIFVHGNDFIRNGFICFAILFVFRNALKMLLVFGNGFISFWK